MSPRVLGAVLGVATISLLSSLGTFFQISDVYASVNENSGVGTFQKRFVPLRAALPAHGVVGYLSDLDVPADDASAIAEYHLTQYSLAPLVVVNSIEHRYVVGNFRKTVSTSKLTDMGLRVMHSFGQGVALLENERKK